MSRPIRQFVDYDAVSQRNGGTPSETFAFALRSSAQSLAYGRFAKHRNYHARNRAPSKPEIRV